MPRAKARVPRERQRLVGLDVRCERGHERLVEPLSPNGSDTRYHVVWPRSAQFCDRVLRGRRCGATIVAKTERYEKVIE